MARLALIKQSYLQVVCSLFKHTHTGNVDVNKHSPFSGLLSEIRHPQEVLNLQPSNWELFDPRGPTVDKEARLEPFGNVKCLSDDLILTTSSPPI